MNTLTLVARGRGEVHAITLHDNYTVTLILKPSGAFASGRAWEARKYAEVHFQWIAQKLDEDGFAMEGPVQERNLGLPGITTIRRLATSGKPTRVQNNTRRLLLGQQV